MKLKQFSLTFILIITFSLLAGCGSERKLTLEERMGDESVIPTSYEGELQALDKIDLYQKGTHQLMTEDDGVIILQLNV